MSTPIKPVNDATASLGTIHTVTQQRDAIHLAVEPVIAGGILRPGDHIGIRNGFAMKATDKVKALGIVDPFLTNFIGAGEKFYLILFPRMITSLRHVWEHPDFQPLVPVVEEPTDPEAVHKMRVLIGDPEALAKQLLMDAADGLGVEFDELMDHAHAHRVDSSHYWVHEDDGGKFEGESLPAGFWEAYETYTGKVVPSESKYSFLDCSC